MATLFQYPLLTIHRNFSFFYSPQISAHTTASLRANALRLKEYIAKAAPEQLPSIAYTYIVGRTHFDRRVMFTGSSKEELLACVEEYLTQKEGSHPKGIKGMQKYFVNPTSSPSGGGKVSTIKYTLISFLSTTKDSPSVLWGRT